MKQLTCEMCGSTDLIKQDGVFVCQTCGCKYSIEEARKMMVEGTVDVTGSRITVDTSEKLEKILTLARRARAEDNTEEAKKYYDLALMEDPDNWESNFYSSYYKLLESPVGKLSEALANFRRRANTALQIILTTTSDSETSNRIDDLFEHTSNLYQIIAAHVESKRQEMINGAINNSTSDMLRSLSMGTTQNAYLKYQEDEIKEKRQQDNARARDNFYSIMKAMRTSILELYAVLEAHPTIREKSGALKNLLTTCTALYCVDAKRIVEMKNYEQFVDDLLAFEEIMYRQIPEYDGQARRTLENQAKAISESPFNRGKPNTGTSVLNLLPQKDSQIRQKRKEKRIAMYWERHPAEKARLDSKKAILQADYDKLNHQNEEICKKINQITADYKNRSIPASKERDAIKSRVRELVNQRAALGLFKGKQRREITEEIASAEAKLPELEALAAQQKEAQDEACRMEQQPLKDESDRLRKMLQDIKTQIDEIDAEIFKDR